MTLIVNDITVAWMFRQGKAETPEARVTPLSFQFSSVSVEQLERWLSCSLG